MEYHAHNSIISEYGLKNKQENKNWETTPSSVKFNSAHNFQDHHCMTDNSYEATD
jgi:hypothetical protein